MRQSLRVVICLLVVGLALPASQVFGIHAEPDPGLKTKDGATIAVSVRGSVGLVQGEAHEYVYMEDGSKGSELIWDLTGLYLGGVVLSANVIECIDIAVGVWTALNDGSGNMDDYDWMQEGRADWTDWSHHDVSVDAVRVLDLNASLRLVRQESVFLRATVGYKQDTWEWSDFGGTYVYSEGGFRNDVGTFPDQTGITYEQTFTMPYAGLSAAFERGRLGLGAYVLYSPFVTAEDEDDHIDRATLFNGEADGGSYLGLGASVLYRISPRLSVSAAVDYQSIPKMKCDTALLEYETGYAESIPDGGGMENTATFVSANVGWRF
ncbi:MAG: omptin family outer membrane protease [Kiritimatiellae bacterium]|nr:omptin family outer membrane protease [Kiritimatiellia bacterium]